MSKRIRKKKKKAKQHQNNENGLHLLNVLEVVLLKPANCLQFEEGMDGTKIPLSSAC